MSLQPLGRFGGALPPADAVKDAHAGEFAALARFLAFRDDRPGGRALRQAEEDLLAALRVPTDLDRVRDAFEQRLNRQKTQGDVKGAAATRSAMRLIDEHSKA